MPSSILLCFWVVIQIDGSLSLLLRGQSGDSQFYSICYVILMIAITLFGHENAHVLGTLDTKVCVYN